MVPEIPDKVIWALAVVATLAAMATHGHAGVNPMAALGQHVSHQLTASNAIAANRSW
ncbi:MAG TPA: hypothetical protein VHU18_08435 [Rhizomicrobium sp.]|jgi:hypothetical protein|nr:hypothetical protein [Rhizomicrobium sp.]